MYKVNNKVMHALHGLGTIESIEEKEILGSISTFAVVAFDKMQVMVNLQSRNSSIRIPITSDGVEHVMDHLKNCTPELPSNHNQRHKMILELIKAGNIEKTCLVVKGLTLLSTKRDLAARDAKALEQSMRLLSEELGNAVGSEPEDLLDTLTQACLENEKELVNA
jgi:CarD family transcriptional regulator, regulator of rRNA transcription